MSYTKIEDISRRLNQYLEVPNSSLIPAAAAKKVDPVLLDRLITQKETMIDLGLKQIYVLPIPNDAKEARIILGEISEKLVCAEVMATYFTQPLQGEFNNGMGFGEKMQKEAIHLLKTILYGHGVYIPGLMEPPMKNAVMSMYTQPMTLPGVELKLPEDQPDVYSRSFSYLAERESSPEENPFNYDHRSSYGEPYY